MFGNLGATEIMLIVVVVLILFGGKKIPELAKGIGKGITEFKRGVKDIEEEINIKEDLKKVTDVKEDLKKVTSLK